MAVGTVTQVVAAGIAVWLLVSSLAAPASRSRVVFWAWLVVAGFLLGVAVHGARDTIGLAHICLQPLILIAVAASATALPRLPWLVRVLALAGLAWDYLVGVMLQFWLEHLPVTVSMIVQPDGSSTTANSFGMDWAAHANATIKQAHQLAFLGDAWPEACPRLWACAVLVGLAAWVSLVFYAFRSEATRGSRVFMHRFFAW
jgi:hypothetical protein